MNYKNRKKVKFLRLIIHGKRQTIEAFYALEVRDRNFLAYRIPKSTESVYI